MNTIQCMHSFLSLMATMLLFLMNKSSWSRKMSQVKEVDRMSTDMEKQRALLACALFGCRGSEPESEEIDFESVNE